MIKWSGVSHNDVVNSERMALPPWPNSPFVMEEELLYHPELPAVCESICEHGNHSLAPQQVKNILEMYIHGVTCRKIGESLSICHVTVFRVQKKLNEWALLIESREE